MNADEKRVQGSIGMTRGSLLRIEQGRGLVVEVREGALWLTQEGDPRDRHVGAGDWFRLDRDGVAIATALRRSALTLHAADPLRRPRRVALARSGSALPFELYSGARARPALGARLRRAWRRLFAPHARPTTAAI